VRTGGLSFLRDGEAEAWSENAHGCWRSRADHKNDGLPHGEKRRLKSVYRILSPGIGGTGVITINALLATAAAMDGLSVATLDQTGLAQKGGAWCRT